MTDMTPASPAPVAKPKPRPRPQVMKLTEAAALRIAAFVLTIGSSALLAVSEEVSQHGLQAG